VLACVRFCVDIQVIFYFYLWALGGLSQPV
jgi:hypothetical protein